MEGLGATPPNTARMHGLGKPAIAFERERARLHGAQCAATCLPTATRATERRAVPCSEDQVRTKNWTDAATHDKRNLLVNATAPTGGHLNRPRGTDGSLAAKGRTAHANAALNSAVAGHQPCAGRRRTDGPRRPRHWRAAPTRTDTPTPRVQTAASRGAQRST
jgi:hypothetical protein